MFAVDIYSTEYRGSQEIIRKTIELNNSSELPRLNFVSISFFIATYKQLTYYTPVVRNKQLIVCGQRKAKTLEECTYPLRL